MQIAKIDGMGFIEAILDVETGGQLLAEIDEDDDEIMDLIQESSAQFDSAVAERFAQEKIEDE